MNKNDEIMVSVSCIAYNHEKYIRQCLDSLVMQKTNFKYQIIVHDDASTDNTANIIKEYEKKYPDLIKPIYQIENQYSKGVSIHSTYVVPKMEGKYCAFCEGDDFWTDPYKLQKQFDVMEKNPDCSICVHKVQDVLENGKLVDLTHPDFELEETKINLKKYFDFNVLHPFQTTSYFIRMNIKKEYALNPPSFIGKFKVGDVPTVLFALTKGDMYYLDETMSCYRLMSEGSWSKKNIESNAFCLSHRKNLVNGFNDFNKFTNYKYDSYIRVVCEKNSFLVSLYSKDYKTCLNKSNKKYFNTILSTKEKIAVIVYAVFPFVEKLISKSRK